MTLNRRTFCTVLAGSAFAKTPDDRAEAFKLNANEELVKAKGTTSARTLAERFGDIVNLKDFGAIGDGKTDDTSAWNAWKMALKNGGLGFIPAGHYLVNRESFLFNSGCIGNGLYKPSSTAETFADLGGFWTQVSKNPTHAGYLKKLASGTKATDMIVADDNDNDDKFTILKNRVAYTATNSLSSHIVHGPQIKTQTEVEYDMTMATKSFNFTRVLGAYHEGIGKGNYACSKDNATGNFTVLAATASNKFAGQFGMTAITGRVWDAKESEIPNIKIYGASKSCAGYFPFIRRSKYDCGGYMIGLETYCINNADESTEVPYNNSDMFNFTSWTAGYHCTGSATGAPITTAILIDGSKISKHSFWNGIVIGGSAMKINDIPGQIGSVGLNFASWHKYSTAQKKAYIDSNGKKSTKMVDGSYGDICIKYNHVGRFHHYYKAGCSIHAANTKIENHLGNTLFNLVCKDGAKSVIYLSSGATELNNREAVQSDGNAESRQNNINWTRGGRFAIVKTEKANCLEIESGNNSLTGWIKLIVHDESDAKSSRPYYLSSNTFCPAWSKTAKEKPSLGTSDKRWNNIYLYDGVVKASDSRLKQDITSVPDVVLDAWSNIEWIQFRLRSRVSERGKHARLHTGLTAQDVALSFSSKGLDASRYGLFCHDKWDDRYEDCVVEDSPAYEDNDGATHKATEHITRVKTQSAGDIYSIRYGEALCMEAAWVRREIAKIKAKIGIE